ncbi:MAG TPA: carbohydrate binding domain-containing protein [Candidatus Methylomirabilis sp.]|nr:carbohydrate binding domain-containing protein [Candidatus Methylomirabilis sp.]
MVSRLDAPSARILAAGLMLLSFLLACAAALRPWVAQWVGSGAPPDRAARRALLIDPGNDRFHTILATVHQYSLLLRDYPTALTHYHLALRSNPLDSASWLNLGKLYQKLDRPREADHALRLAVHLAPTDSNLAWEASLAYLEAEHLPEAIRTLTRYLSLSRDVTGKAAGYDLARRLASPEELLDRVIPQDVTNYAHYLNYLLDRNQTDEALRVWGRLRAMPSGARERIDPNLRLRFVDALMSGGAFGPAQEVWTTTMKDVYSDAASGDSNLVSNGGFERGSTLGRGFDWKIGGAPGVQCDLDGSIAYAGRQSLRIAFGKTHPEFSNVSQIIHVRPDSIYSLEAYIRTNGLDGSHGMNLEVIDPLKGLLTRTETIAGTRDWTKVGVTFRTPQRSQTVTLRVHREAIPQSLQLNAGTAWIDNLSMTKVR